MTEPEVEGPFARVAFPLPLQKQFSYTIPDTLSDQLQRGSRVRAPFGHRTITGYCTGFSDQTDVEPDQMKALLDVVDDEPLVDESLLELTRWMASYYLCSWGQVLEAALPGPVRDGASRKTKRYVTLCVSGNEVEAYIDELSGRFEARRRILRIMSESEESRWPAQELTQEADCSQSPLDTLENDGIVEQFSEKEPFENLYERLPDPDPVPEQLTDAQENALDAIDQAATANRHETFLLHGVTGSGKTEVYLRSIRDSTADDEQALVLIPEISLTPQAISRFRDRFDRVAIMHSYLSDPRRRREWHRIQSGEVDVIIGARSALFAPAPNLGLIVVDEEHDSSYKQDRVPRYNARDGAVLRGSLEDVPVILGSATPSLESRYNAETGKYTLLELPDRIGDSPLPNIRKIDMTMQHDTGSRTVISETLEVEIRKTLSNDNQAMLFLNRRGFASVIYCPACQEHVKCPQCDISLTYHQSVDLLKCHHCNHRQKRPKTCPHCDRPSPIDLGMGTERIESTIRSTFPDAQIERMDSDTMTDMQAYENTVRKLQNEQVDLLVGTQMIAKGLHFPGVTLVGIISADTSLHLPDFRSAEDTFQLITQIAGRAGRGESAGRVLLQTYEPDHYSIRTAVDYDYTSFWSTEIDLRERMGYPPFTSLLRILIRGKDEDQVIETAAGIRDEIQPDCQHHDIDLLGPAPAPLSKLQNRYRHHVLLKLPEPKLGRKLVDQHARLFQSAGATEVVLDMDPVSIL